VPLSSAEKPSYDIEYQTQKNTEENTGRDGKIEADILTFDGNVTGKLPEPTEAISKTGNPVEDDEQYPQCHNPQSNSYEGLPECGPFRQQRSSQPEGA
jgi:hypothetical protein